jgi:hypothetical protein
MFSAGFHPPQPAPKGASRRLPLTFCSPSLGGLGQRRTRTSVAIPVTKARIRRWKRARHSLSAYDVDFLVRRYTPKMRLRQHDRRWCQSHRPLTSLREGSAGNDTFRSNSKAWVTARPSFSSKQDSLS